MSLRDSVCGVTVYGIVCVVSFCDLIMSREMAVEIWIVLQDSPCVGDRSRLSVDKLPRFGPGPPIAYLLL